MQGIKIKDLVSNSHVLAVDLRHVLDLLGERAMHSSWLASDVWATDKDAGEAAQELEKLADGRTYIPGDHLCRVAHKLRQVIDGEFAAFNKGDDSPWIIIRAVDSSFYEVFSPETDVLRTVREAFQQVSDCEYVANQSAE